MPAEGENRAEYVARINRVIDFVEAHLNEELPLDRLAQVACFSPFHFHRIFSAMMGETLQRFVQRLRLERAAAQLLNDEKRSVTEIALDTGFASSATFARAFRNEFGMSATDWRKLDDADRKMSKTDRNDGKAATDAALYLHETEGRANMTNALKAEVEVKELVPQRVAYLRHVGPYQGDNALFGQLFGKLAMWAGPRGLLGPSATFVSVYHDDPGITDQSKLRTSVGVAVGGDVEVDGEIGAMVMAGGKYACARFRIDANQYPDAWNALMGGWLPDSGYQPADGPPMERYLNQPDKDPEGKHEVEICVPVKPL